MQVFLQYSNDLSLISLDLIVEKGTLPHSNCFGLFMINTEPSSDEKTVSGSSVIFCFVKSFTKKPVQIEQQRLKIKTKDLNILYK